MRILNVGCGHDNYGTDRIDIVKTPTTTKVYDLNKGLPYPDNCFDEIKAQAVLEHIKDIGLFANECYRVLKKNGKLYIRTDNAAYIFFHISKKHEHNAFIENQYKSHDYKHDTKEDAHYHLFVPSNLIKLFREFRKHTIKYHYGGRNKIVHSLLKILPYHLGAIQVEMRCIK